MKSIEELIGTSKQELLQIYGLGSDAIPAQIDGRSYLELPEVGISFVLSADNKATTIHLYARGRDSYSQYAGPMPFGLRFDMSRDTVRTALGKPHKSMDEIIDPLLGKVNARDIYVLEKNSVSVEYTPNMNEISLISIAGKLSLS